MFDKQNELNNLINLNLAASFRDEKMKVYQKSSLGQKTSNIVGQMEINQITF